MRQWSWRKCPSSDAFVYASRLVAWAIVLHCKSQSVTMEHAGEMVSDNIMETAGRHRTSKTWESNHKLNYLGLHLYSCIKSYSPSGLSPVWSLPPIGSFIF